MTLADDSAAAADVVPSVEAVLEAVSERAALSWPEAAHRPLRNALGRQPVLGFLVVPHMGIGDDGFETAVEVLALRERNLLHWMCWEEAPAGDSDDDESGEEPTPAPAPRLEARVRIMPYSQIQQVWLNQNLSMDPGQELPDLLRLTIVLGTQDSLQVRHGGCNTPGCTEMHLLGAEMYHEMLNFGGARETLGDETVRGILDFAAQLDEALR